VKTGLKAKTKTAKPIKTKKPAAAAPSSRGSPKPVARTDLSRIPARQLVPRRPDTRPLKSSVGLIHGIPPYQPKVGEPYMNDRQLDHFRNILLAWKRELMEEVDRTVHHMQDEASNFPDPNDRATQESEFGLELRTRDRERKLLKKIEAALERIDDGSYGYCEETGEEIGLKRLEARPVATLSVEAQERRELAERQFRDREDGF
jgi:DnaK suppressor protein